METRAALLGQACAQLAPLPAPVGAVVLREASHLRRDELQLIAALNLDDPELLTHRERAVLQLMTIRAMLKPGAPPRRHCPVGLSS
jgi:hypothetical protein